MHQLARQLRILLVAVLVLMPVATTAAGLSNRSDTMTTSQASGTGAHLIAFTTATTDNIGSIKFEFCTTAVGACTTPTGLVTTSVALTGQTGATGFTMDNTTNGAPFITRAPANLPASTAVTYTLGGIVNPSGVNETFYVRVTTYTGIDGATGAVDTGTIAVSTAERVQLTGVTPEILIFCVGTTITTDCSSATGSLIDFGDFDPTLTRSGTSMMQAMTNASGGYVITVNGTTLSSGINTIPALTTQAASDTGVGQFGLNLRNNGTPNVGADVTGPGGGTVAATYGTANQYRFNNGDTVASAPAPTDANTYTSSYIVNIAGSQAAGVYTATMTYICTAAF